MILIEILLSLFTILTLLFATKSDLKKGIIPNKLIISHSISCAILNIIYHFVSAGTYLVPFISNLIGMSVIAILFYGLGVWAGGDSKLLISTTLGIPVRWFVNSNLGFTPCFLIVVYTFSLAYIYIIGESAILSIKGKKTASKAKIGRINFSSITSFLTSFAFIFLLLLIINTLIDYGCAKLNISIGSSAYIINFITAVSIYELRRKLSNKELLIGIAIAILSFIVMALLKLIPFENMTISWITFAFSFLIMLIRIFGNQFNYQEIPTLEVKENMILSAHTVMLMNFSKGIDNLPNKLSEDRKARLTNKQIAAIKIWEKTKLGKPTITIVRKIPFAIFILLGTLIFLGMEVYRLWFI